MGPSIDAVSHAARLFSDPAVRAQVRTWHLESTPLIEMVDRLGFADLFDDQLRAAVTNLTPDEVESIRRVFMAEIDRAGGSDDSTMPISCEIADVTGPVSVTVRENHGREEALITPRRTP